MGSNRQLFPNGINVARGMQTSRGTNEALNLDRFTPDPITGFVRCVVIDNITRIDDVSDETLDAWADKGISIDFVKYAPRNAVIAAIISGAQAKLTETYVVLYPFFSPHLSLPVKPGEVIWAFFEGEESTVGYWLTRVHSQVRVDDVNYTHDDRRLTAAGIMLKKSDVDQDPPNFPNGAQEFETQTFTAKNAFEDIFKQANANKLHVYESVPRFSKRPGDLVIQGSNNALICLGSERTRDLETQKEGMNVGAIDIVVGRGIEPTPFGEGTSGTSASTIKNTRGLIETNVNPLTDKHHNVDEGNPDFEKDVSRIYISMRSDIDNAFTLVYPENVVGGSTETIEDDAVVALKSNHIRAIAREDGSIRLIKEGAGSEASVIIHENGTVQIDAEKIQLGRDAGDDKGYVRYSQYKEQMELLTKLLNDLYTQMIAQFTAGPNSTPGYGGPNPGLVKLVTDVTTAKASVVELQSKIPNAKSQVIFGE